MIINNPLAIEELVFWKIYGMVIDNPHKGRFYSHLFSYCDYAIVAYINTILHFPLAPRIKVELVKVTLPSSDEHK